MPGYFKVCKFEELQHYKDRNPPWIKLYNDLLDDYEFSCLSDVKKIHLVLIWLLASRMENKLPIDSAWIKSKIGAQEEVDLDGLMETKFLEPWDGGDEPLEWGSRYISKETKELIMERDGGKCQNADCGSRENVEFDHIIPISKGGTSAPDNLQLLCRSCNRKKRVRSKDYTSAEHDATQKRSLEGEGEQSRGRAEGEGAPPRKKPIPTDFSLTDDLIAYASKQGIQDLKTLDGFTDRFVNQCKAKGYRYVDFKSTWKNWLRRDIEEGKLKEVKYQDSDI